MRTANSVRIGLLIILASSFMSGFSGVPYFSAYQEQPDLSLWVGSFIRVLCNAVFVVFMVLKEKGDEPSVILYGNREPSLFWWGILGAITTTTSFASLVYLGNGLSQLFQLVSIVIVTALRPWFLGEKNTTMTWVLLVGSTVGFLLVRGSLGEHPHPIGILYGTISSVACGFAWLFAVKAGRQNKPVTVMAYWSFFALLTHVVLLLVFRQPWPNSDLVWRDLIATGVLVTLAQYTAMIAYQKAPAAPVAAMGYIAPVMAVCLDYLVFDIQQTNLTLIGGSLVVLFGVILPFLRPERGVMR